MWPGKTAWADATAATVIKPEAMQTLAIIFPMKTPFMKQN